MKSWISRIVSRIVSWSRPGASAPKFEYPKEKGISWDQLLEQGINGWQLKGIENPFYWRSGVVRAQRKDDKIHFLLLGHEVRHGQEWHLVNQDIHTLSLSATPLYKTLGGWRFDILYIGTFLLSPPEKSVA